MLFHISDKTALFLREKLISALFPAGLFLLTQSEAMMLSAICWMVAIDTVLGVKLAIKHKKFSSTEFSRVINKIFLYFSTMMVALIVSNLEIPCFDFIFYYIGAFIVLNEALSCFEKIGFLGFPKIKNALVRVNKEFYNWCEGDETAKENIFNRHKK